MKAGSYVNIIATVRKSEKDTDLLSKYRTLYDLGIRLFRFNYAKYENNHEQLIKDTRLLNTVGNHIEIIIDLPYPGRKPRLMLPFRTLTVTSGEEVILLRNEDATVFPNDKSILKLDCNIISEHLTDVKIVYYDSGQGAFKITEVTDNYIVLKALCDFCLYNMKALLFGHIPKVDYLEKAKEIIDITNPNEIALSFVSCAYDLRDIMKLKEKYGFRVTSKIEDIVAINNLESILSTSDAIMIGRGDLCLHSDYRDLFSLQTHTAEQCKLFKKNLYIATDFMSSMTHQYIPNRSEIIDLSYALSLDPDAIVLNLDLCFSPSIARVIDMIGYLDRKGRTIQTIK